MIYSEKLLFFESERSNMGPESLTGAEKVASHIIRVLDDQDVLQHLLMRQVEDPKKVADVG
jgi:hypothetical protein